MISITYSAILLLSFQNIEKQLQDNVLNAKLVVVEYIKQGELLAESEHYYVLTHGTCYVSACVGMCCRLSS